MPIKSPISIFAGVPPRMCPTLRSCSISPATADETQTTAATPNTAATPPVPETPNRDHQKRRNHQGAERQSRHGIVRRTNHAHQVSGNGGEEKAEHDHYARSHQRSGDHLRTRQVPCAGDEPVVQRNHRQEYHSDSGENEFGWKITLGAGWCPRVPPPTSFRSETARPMPDHQLFAHLEQRVAKRRPACRPQQSAARWSSRWNWPASSMTALFPPAAAPAGRDGNQVGKKRAEPAVPRRARRRQSSAPPVAVQ